ncbi:MAG: transcriptional repressor [Chloroflexi bacterium]|nr:transcriptional repressor [Chloroflexota bacterium]
MHATRRRVTEQRRLLLEIIRAHGEHLDADQIYALARQQNPRLSLSTVYRTLSLLRDLGLVDEVHLGEDHHHYELKPATAHHHLICHGCGRVTEFSTFLADELAASVGAEYGYDVQEVRIDLMGLCAGCHAAQEQEPGEEAPTALGEAPQGREAGLATPLSSLQPGDAGVVAGLAGGSGLGARLAGLGFAPGTELKVLQARAHGPLIVLLRDTRVALGAGEASQVLVIPTEQAHG